MTISRSLRAVIFDLDGTLVDTAGEIATALHAAFEELQLAPLARPAVQALIGRGVHSMVERALAQRGAGSLLQPALERFEQHYAAVVATKAELFPGAMKGLRLLEKAGIRRAVVTNKPRFFAEKLLERLKVDTMMDAVVAGDDGIPRKPSGDMLIAACRQMGCDVDSALMVGDSENDVVAARDAGCPVWCVPYGYNEGRGPETLGCDRLVADIEEAARLIMGSDSIF